MNSKTLIETTDVSYAYPGKTVHFGVKDISLSIVAGEFVAITGPSGSGKTTLMHILGCMLMPTGGSYRLMGQEISNQPANRLADWRNTTIGFVFQNYNLLPRISALDNVALPLIYGGVSRTKRKQRAMQALTSVGLENRASHAPNELSGGEQQRVAIARAIIMQPRLLLADEPTGNLDQANGRKIMNLLAGLTQEGITVVYVTHDQALVRMARRTIRLVDGRLNEQPRMEKEL